MSPRKFVSLPGPQQVRKLTRLVHDQRIKKNKNHWEFLALLRAAIDLLTFAPFREPMEAILSDPTNPRTLFRLEILLSQTLGEGPGDWDLSPPLMSGGLLPTLELPGPARLEVYLEDLRSPFNVGSIFRTADGVGCSKVILSPLCPGPGIPRVDRSSMGATQFIPWTRMKPDAVLDYAAGQGLEPRALELGGEELWSTNLPQRCLLILGSEEFGVSGDLLNSTPRVSIPMAGTKASFNVGVSFGIAGAWWLRQVSLIRK